MGPVTLRKKPITVEAYAYDGSEACAKAIAAWDTSGSVSLLYADDEFIGMYVKTLEGTMRAIPSDMIVRGAKGEMYPVKQDVLEETFEPVEEETNYDYGWAMPDIEPAAEDDEEGRGC